MKALGLVVIATMFYLGVVALFWPIEKKIVPTSGPRITASGYAYAEVVFSDDHIRVRIPSTIQLQEKGLAGVTKLSDDEGMLWTYNTPRRVSFWMKGMLIPLDFVWINSGHIVDLTKDVAPPSGPASTDLPIIDPGVPVDGVLEVGSGFIERHQLKVGDAVQVQ